MPAASEARHPIGVVAERTGLSPDVLRVWERRYGVVEPRRSPGGQRVYSDADIERLTLLQRATHGGHGISHVASLGRAKLEELVREIESAGSATPARFVPAGQFLAAIDQATAFTRGLDPAGLENVLRRSAARFGVVALIDEIAAPFLRSVGDAWHAGELTVAQEHFATVIVQRVVSQVAPLLTGAEGGPTIVMGTLEGERHAVGALMAAATAASEGWRVMFLGADLPAGEIADTAVRTRARAVGISVVLAEKKARTASDLRAIERAIPPDATLLVGGAGAKTLQQTMGRSRIVFLSSASELRTQLGTLKSSG